MDKNDVTGLIDLRTAMIERFNRLRDYKNNPNAIMKEIEYAKNLEHFIKRLDSVLKNHVNFTNSWHKHPLWIRIFEGGVSQC